MISSFFCGKFCIGVFGYEIAEGGRLSLELARLVAGLDPVGDGTLLILREMVQPENCGNGEKKNEAGEKRIAAYRHGGEVGVARGCSR